MKSKSKAKRPLQVGDRVSYEGFNERGYMYRGKGIIIYLADSYGTVLIDGSERKEIFGLRSFRRLVKKIR